MAAIEQERIIMSLLSVLSLVLLTAGAMVFLIIHWRHRKSMPASADSHAPDHRLSPLPSAHPQHFAAKRAASWLSIKSANVQAVQSALALHNPKPCSWAEGLSGDHEQSLFIAPPVDGWILVVGPALPDPSDDVDVSYRFLADLSRKLGQVQFFHINSVLNNHAWVRADSGRIIRAYAWAGKTLWNQGPLTPAEQALRMRCYDYCETAEPALFSSAEHTPANADKVHLLASRWSLDPADIGWRGAGNESGIIGKASRFF
jgi:hypothetical protein